MAGYLEEYAQGEERSQKRTRWIIIVGSVLFGLLVLYFAIELFRPGYLQGIVDSWRAREHVARVEQFRQLLAEGKTREAYDLWCSEQHPCQAYPYERFLDDWGPQSPYTQAGGAAIQIEKVEYCDEGTIVTLEAPQEPIALWVDHDRKRLTFAPWPVCDPVVRVPRVR